MQITRAAVPSLIALALAGCGGGQKASTHGFPIDDHPYDSQRCSTSYEANDCIGVTRFEVVANETAREYLVTWIARYERAAPPALYGRRFDARSGRALSKPVELMRSAPYAPLVVADPATHGYVMAYQGGGVTVRRWTRALQPAGGVARFRGWRLFDIVAEPAGRVALVGMEHVPESGSNPRPPTPAITLRVETLDVRNRSLGVERRDARRAEYDLLGLRATYDVAARRVLVVWRPALLYATPPPWRFETFAARGGGGAGAAQISQGGGNAVACNPRRHDCLVVYSNRHALGERPEPLRARLFTSGGRRLGPEFELPESNGAPAIGIRASGAAYAVTWQGVHVSNPNSVEVVDGTVSGPARVAIGDRREVPGDALVAHVPSTGTRLLAWLEPGEHNSRTLVGRILR
jgi:hypothetical protein